MNLSAVPPRVARTKQADFSRRALTLFELLLVLALLVVLAGLSMPALQGAFAGARLRHGGDQLRSAWSRARLASLESGITHTFRCVWGSEQYHIQTQADDLASGGTPAVDVESDDGNPRITFSKSRLTSGVTFTEGWWLPENAQSDTADIQQQGMTGQWSDPILFHPDGTTSDASVILQNDRGHQLRVTLRGLTGVSVAGEARDEGATR